MFIFWLGAMSVIDTHRNLIVQLHFATAPVGGTTTHITQNRRKVDLSMSFRVYFDNIPIFAPYQLVAIDLFESLDTSATPYNVDDVDQNIGEELSAIEGLAIKPLAVLRKLSFPMTQSPMVGVVVTRVQILSMVLHTM